MTDQNPEPVEKVYRPRGKMMLDNFLGGLAWSLGTFVGAVIFLALIGYILSQINIIPIIGNWIAEMLQTAMENSFKNSPTLPPLPQKP